MAHPSPLPSSGTTPDFSIITSGRYDPSLSSLHDTHGSNLYLLRYHYDRLAAAAQAFAEFHDAKRYLESKKGALDGAPLINSWLEEHFEAKYGTRTPVEPLKFRILLSPSRQQDSSRGTSTESKLPMEITSSSVPTLPLSSFYPSTLYTHNTLDYNLRVWRVFCLPHAVSLPQHPAAAYKTTARDVYDAARAELASRLYGEGVELPANIEVLLPVMAPGTKPPTTDSTDPESTPWGSDAQHTELSEGTRSTPYVFRDGKWVTPRAEAGGCQGIARRWALSQNLATEAHIPIRDLQWGEHIWLSNGVRGFGWGPLELWPE